MESTPDAPTLSADVCHRAVEAQDPRFDGVFYVGIVTTGIYCRPICPSRRANPDNRRFFRSAAAAERAGLRPCLRCRPELAPGRALVDAVSRVAAAAAERIAEGALNGRRVRSLASELCVSERHLRRCLKREVGASPIELAQTHRLLMAKRLLADTELDMSRVAYASGFQSLRRFNAVVRQHYGLTPTDLRRRSTDADDELVFTAPSTGSGDTATEPLRLDLTYRAPFAWDALVAFLGRRAASGVEVVRDGCYARTVEVEERTGVVSVEDVPGEDRVVVEVSLSLVPVLMPVLTRLRRLFDLDAEPTVVDAHLADGGLDAHVRRRPGLRIPGAFDGFEVAMKTFLRDSSNGERSSGSLADRIAAALGDPIDGGRRDLDRIAPGAERVADVGVAELVEIGVPEARARVLAALARRVADGSLRLDPGGDPVDARRALGEIGLDAPLATTIAMRALGWPDAFPASDPALQRAAGASSQDDLSARAEKWRPWRSYAAVHLWTHHEGSGRAAGSGRGGCPPE